MLAAAKRRRTQAAQLLRFTNTFSTLNNDITTMWSAYNKEVDYLNGAWSQVTSSFSLSPNAPSLTNATAYMYIFSSTVTAIQGNVSQLGLEAGALQSAGLAEPSLQSGYQTLVSASATLLDDEDAMNNELTGLTQYANGGGALSGVSTLSSYISETNQDLPQIEHSLTVAVDYLTEFAGAAGSKVADLPNATSGGSSA